MNLEQIRRANTLLSAFEGLRLMLTENPAAFVDLNYFDNNGISEAVAAVMLNADDRKLINQHLLKMIESMYELAGVDFQLRV